MAVVFMLVAVGGCAKKEAEEAAEAEATDEVMEEVAQEVGLPAVGTYTAQLPSADSPGRTITLALNADNTATMSVDMMNNQPAMVENGSWAWNATSSMVDLTIQREVSGAMVSSMMSFALSGDTLSLSNPADAGYGDMGVKLVKSAGDDSHDGHSH
jgi:uncharacterized lipoprotein NlpE involved in copper resistance